MPELTSAALPTVTSGGPGTEPAYGRQAGDIAPAGSIASSQASGEPSQPEVTPHEQPQPTGDSSLGWKSLDEAERDYKNVQAAFTKATQALKELGDPSTVRSNRALLENLRNDPEFQQWAEARVAKHKTGQSDPQTLEAIRLVQEMVRQGVQTEIAPLRAHAIEQKTKTVFSEMTTEFGPEWEQYKPKMLELHAKGLQRGWVSPRLETDFDYEYVKGLYAQVVLADPNHAARQYQKKLDGLRAQATTSQPGTAPQAVGTGKARTFEEAAAMAKKQLGWS